MKAMLFVFAVLAFLNGVVGAMSASTVFQQIQGGISFVIAAVLFSGAAIVEAVNRLEKKSDQPQAKG